MAIPFPTQPGLLELRDVADEACELFARLHDVTARALEGVHAADLDVLFHSLDQRQVLLKDAETLLARVQARWDSLGRDPGAAADQLVERVRRSAEAAVATDARLQVALVASRDQVAHELDQIDAAGMRTGRYRAHRSPQGSTIDTRR